MAYRTSGREDAESRNRRARLSRWQFVVGEGVTYEGRRIELPASPPSPGASLAYGSPARDDVAER